MTNETPINFIRCPDPGMRVLIANRGEIARRIIRTTNAWGVDSVAVYAEPDASAPHVSEATSAELIGPAALADSYLSIDALIAAAQRSDATHVHPGYGFLSERTEFAQAVTDAGLIWVGPAPASVASMGSKIEARRVAVEAGVPVIPGIDTTQDNDELFTAAGEIGYPVLVKASAGGGGKGIRIANSPDDFSTALSEARTESLRAFGDDDVIVERYITRPRHIEVQVAGDKHGAAIDFGTRECSVQRRYQKVLEEAPATSLPDDVHQAMRAAAVTLTERIGYDSVGTVEFIVDAATNEFFFLEMNTRIQVEHTVTEQILDIDLIALQLSISSGEPIPFQADFFESTLAATPKHAIEVRINAEDAWAGHLPQTGTVTALSVPGSLVPGSLVPGSLVPGSLVPGSLVPGSPVPGSPVPGSPVPGTIVEGRVRWDAAIVEGSEISPHYDSMVGKLIVTAENRVAAIDAMTSALDELIIEGLTTNVDFHRWLIRQPEVRAARVTTRFLDETPLPTSSPFDDSQSTPNRSTPNPLRPWGSRLGRRLTPHRSSLAFDSESRDDRWHDNDASGTAGISAVAPFPGLVTEIAVLVGDIVEAGQLLATIEAMKMLHPINAGGPARIAAIHVNAGEQVEGNTVLIEFEQLDLPPTSGETP